MLSSDVIMFFIVIAGIALPLLFLFIRPRTATLVYLALIPLYMYHKSIFSIIDIAGKEIQWPTLAKDLVGVFFIIFIGATLAISKKRLFSVRHSKLLLFLILFASYYFFCSYFFNNCLFQTIMGIRPYVFYSFIGTLMGALFINRLEDWRIISFGFLIGSIVIAVIVLIQAFLYKDFLILPSMKQIWCGELIDLTSFEYRLKGFFTSPNTLGNFMAIGIIIAFWSLYNRIFFLRPFFLFVTIAIFLWVLILTKSRSSLIAGSLSIFLILHLRASKPYRPFQYLIITILFLTLTFVCYGDRFVNLTENPRISTWSGYLKSASSSLDSFLFGTGVGSIGRYGIELGNNLITIRELEGQISTSGGIYSIDNFFVRCFYETGFLGLLLPLVIVILFLKCMKIAKNHSFDSEMRIYLSLPLSLAFFIFIISLFGDSLITYPWNLLFWIVVSSVISISRQFNTDSANPG